MQTKIILLTFLLTIGFSFTNCDNGSVECSCPPNQGNFIDITGLEATHIRSLQENGATVFEPIEENTTINFANYSGLDLKYLFDFTSKHQPKKQRSSGFIPAAYACSCVASGTLGSKFESLESLEITTLNNFDEEHPAGSSLNDIFRINGQTIEQYIEDQPRTIQDREIFFTLRQEPKIDKTFLVKVTVVLSTEETYEYTLPPFDFE